MENFDCKGGGRVQVDFKFMKLVSCDDGGTQELFDELLAKQQGYVVGDNLKLVSLGQGQVTRLVDAPSLLHALEISL